MTERQVVYQIPGMFESVSQHEHVYHRSADGELRLDLYLPQTPDRGAPWPVVVFVFGFADAHTRAKYGYKLKESGQYISWAHLVAASGCAAVTYETERPESDIHLLLKYLRENADELRIDMSIMGLWACSGNVPTALAVLMGGSQLALKCAVLYYGAMLDWDDTQVVAQAAAESGFANPSRQYDYDDLPPAVPLFIARAGQDQPGLNETIDRFLVEALARNLPLTFANHARGPHAFDVLDDSTASQAIIQQTLAFLLANLQ